MLQELMARIKVRIPLWKSWVTMGVGAVAAKTARFCRSGVWSISWANDLLAQQDGSTKDQRCARFRFQDSSDNLELTVYHYGF